MKFNQSIALFFILPFFGFGQNKTSIDLVAGIDYSYRILQSESSDEIVDFLLTSRAEEVGKLNWRVGFNYNVKLYKRVFLKAGFRFASVGYKRSIGALRWGSESDGNGGFIEDPSLPDNADFTYDHRFIEVPIAGRYEFKNKKWTPFVEIGIAPSFYLITRTKLTTDDSSEVSFQDGNAQKNNKLHAVGLISLGVNYSLNEKLQFFGQPTFRYHFTSLADARIKEHLYNYGIELGLRRKIN